VGLGGSTQEEEGEEEGSGGPGGETELLLPPASDSDAGRETCAPCRASRVRWYGRRPTSTM
jgi:hypothetical protein